LPGPSLMNDPRLRSGDLALGGCEMGVESPWYHCNSCGHEW
jgi:hypothetical protein